MQKSVAIGKLCHSVLNVMLNSIVTEDLLNDIMTEDLLKNFCVVFFMSLLYGLD